MNFKELEKEISKHERRIRSDKSVRPKVEAFKKVQAGVLNKFVKKDVDSESLL